MAINVDNSKYMSVPEIKETLINTFKRSAEKTVNDKTILATIQYCSDATIGQYKIKYQNGYFTAYSKDLSYIYSNGTSVYVLVPRNNMNNRMFITGLATNDNSQKSYGEQNSENIEEKKSKLKIILNSYIKEKELDIFFEKLLTSYTVHEKSKNNVEEILASIKDLVSKKVNLLIKILFDQDEKGWFNSLKLKENDKDGKEYYIKLTGMIQEMMQFEKIQDIPENMVENFGETLLMTPELNSQINKLVLKKFE